MRNILIFGREMRFIFNNLLDLVLLNFFAEARYCCAKLAECNIDQHRNLDIDLVV